MSNELNDDQPVNEMDLLANMECSIVSALIPEVVSTAEEPAVLEQEINDEDKNVPPSTAMEAAISAMFATPEHEEEEEMMMVVGTEPVNDDINNVLISGEDDEKIGISSSSLTPTHLTTTTTMEAETIEGVTAEEEDAAMRDMTPGLVAHPSLPPRPDLISDFPSTTARPVASDFISAAVHSGNPSSSSAIAAVPVGGGGMSKFDQLTARLAKDPRDGEARLALLADVEAKGDLERTREVYEEFLTVFPDASQQWIAYADLELSHGLFPQVEAIFARCLRPSPSVELWKFYLDYIRRVNPIEGERAKEARTVISKSFEFALQHVGQDRRAGEMWMEYIEFLKQSGETRGTWEDQQRMDALRKAYQRAVCIPLNNVEHIWQDYNSFENGLNKMTAKKFVAELSPSYMTARKALRELRAMFDDLYQPALPSKPDWSTQTREHLDLWKRYLAYEEANPLDIEEPATLHARVQFAFKKAIGSMRFFSEIWLLASDFHAKIEKIDEAATLLRSGMEANPSSMLLAYTLSEWEEGKGDFAICHQIYDGLIAYFHGQLAALNAATAVETTEALKQLDLTSAVEQTDAVDTNGDDVESRQQKMEERENLTKLIKEKRQAEVDTNTKAAANVWITKMRFARRAEDMKSARAVFGSARKSPYPTRQVIEAAAAIEYYWNKEVKIANNVFDLGLKTFGSDPDYLVKYLDFLLQSNNDSNARALFEKTVAQIEPGKAKPVWDRWAQYEYQYGDFAAAQRFMTRYSATFPEISSIERFSQRHGHADLSEAIAQDLGTFPVSPLADSLDEDAFASNRNKRRSSAEPALDLRNERAMSVERSNYNSREGVPAADGGIKRLKQFHRDSASPGPIERGGGERGGDRGGWGGRAPREEQRDDFDRGPSRRRALSPPPVRPDLPPPPALFMLDARGDVTGPLPDGVLFFLSILPSAASFNGPILDAATVVEVIANTLLPGSAPGGFQGERLGIPPRRKGASSYNERDRERSASPGAYRNDRGGGGRDDYGYSGGRGGGSGRY